MSRKLHWGIAALLFVVGTWFRAGFDVAGDDGGKAVTVSAEDLSSGKVIVKGRLGIPLKTMATIRGTWKLQDEESHWFHVTHVDEKELAKAFKVHLNFVDVSYPESKDDRIARSPNKNVKEGDVWQFRGYETGGFSGYPPQYWRDLTGREPPDRSGPAYAGSEWQPPFFSSLRGVMPRPKTPSKNPDEGDRGKANQKK